MFGGISVLVGKAQGQRSGSRAVRAREAAPRLWREAWGRRAVLKDDWEQQETRTEHLVCTDTVLNHLVELSRHPCEARVLHCPHLWAKGLRGRELE